MLSPACATRIELTIVSIKYYRMNNCRNTFEVTKGNSSHGRWGRLVPQACRREKQRHGWTNGVYPNLSFQAAWQLLFDALFYGGCATRRMKTLHGERISAECHCTNPLFLVMVEDELLQLQAMPCRFNDRVFWGSIQVRESRWNCWNNSVHKQIVVQRPESSADNASDYEELVTNQTHFLNIILNISLVFVFSFCPSLVVFIFESGQCTHIQNRLATTLWLHSSS